LYSLLLKLTLPSAVETALAVLPRPWLDWAEIYAFPAFCCPHPSSPATHKVALVKSEVCGHIYARPWLGGDLRKLALSTLKTFGPLNLFTRYLTDFIIVRLPADPDCQVWREFYAGDPDPVASARIHEDFRNYRPADEPPGSPSQGDLAVDPESVDWGKYDAVIVQDLCLPARITRNFPCVLWSYWIGETGSRSFKSSFHRPTLGYSLFLNGSSRRWRVRPRPRSHMIEFPYILQNSQTHTHLGAKPWRERSGVLLEVNTARSIPHETRSRLERITTVTENIGTPAERLRLLHRSKYFVQMIPKRLWGNSLNEAVAAGCLSLANPASMPNNRSLLMPGLTPPDWESALLLLQRLESDREWAESQQTTQQRLADWLLCDRPLSEWEMRLADFQAGRSP